MSKKKVYLGIDTSNYTTSIALCDENGNIVLNLKQLLDVKSGERGLRQSDAVFSHIKNFPQLANNLNNALTDYEITSIGVSNKPRDVDGSYMPCFLSGIAVAEMLAATHNIPLYKFSHQAGHIMAALYSSNSINKLLNKSFVAFHVSGGTTEVLLVTRKNETFDVQILCETEDISAGQAIDRAGVMMGMKFPCGKEIEANAIKFNEKLPNPKICVKNGKCNLSGIENISTKLFNETHNVEYVSAYVLNFVSKTLVKITNDIRETYPDIPIVYAGGVMSNSILQKELSKFANTYFATPEFSSDNAAGIALLTKMTNQ